MTVPSPMTTWLAGGRSRQCVCRALTAPMMNGDRVSATLREHNESITTGFGSTIEEAMAAALNALMAETGT